MRISAIAFAAAATLCLPAVAQSMKPGLWEVSSKMGGNPQMEQAMAEMQKQLASMPPEQRKQMEAAMAKQGVKMGGVGAGGAMTAQMCITKEMAERQEMPVNQAGCKITSQSKSGNTTKMAYACTNPPSSGEGTYTYHSAESYSSKMVVKTTVQGRTETTTMDGTGKWLKADCGNVKPIQPPKQ